MNTRRRGGLLLALAAFLTAALAASCSQDGPVRVLAASSLTDTLTELDERKSFSSVGNVDLVFGGSSSLVAQLDAGTPADVVITADIRTMQTAVAQGLASDAITIATNHLVLAVAPGNPGRVVGLADLADDERVIGVCAPDVPCGALATTALLAAAVDISADTEEPNVRSLASKIALGEVDAGLIYHTDAERLELEVIAVEGLAEHVTTYHAAAVNHSRSGSVFVSELAGSEAQATLRSHGFGAP